MLILMRKEGDSLMLGDNIEIKVTEISGNQIKLGISAPSDIRIYRKEIYSTIKENQKAAMAKSSTDAVKNLLSQVKKD